MGKKKTVVVGESTGEKETLKEVHAGETVEANVEKKGGEKRQPKKRSSKYTSARVKVDRAKFYSLDEAVKLAQETSYSKFDGSIEMHMVIRKSKLLVTTKLPFSTGKSKRIEVASEATIKKLQAGKVDFDVLLAKAEMMPKLVPFAKILGPKGMMPNPKNGTLIKSEDDAKKFSADSVTVKTEKSQPVVHVVIGKVSQKAEEIVKNAEAVFSVIGPKQVIKASFSASMGPGVKVKII